MASYDEYIKRLQQSNRKMSYRGFVKLRLRDSEGELKNALARAKRDALFGDIGYGTAAERIADTGLSANTGYSEYLGTLSKQKNAMAVSNVQNTYKAEAAKAASEYSEYEKDFAAAQSKLLTSVMKDIDTLSLNSYDDMLKYAIGAGLSTEYAKTAADTAYSAKVENMRQNVIDAIVTRGYGKSKTYDYAIKLGFDENIANELADYAQKLRDGELTSDYLNGLKNNK